MRGGSSVADASSGRLARLAPVSACVPSVGFVVEYFVDELPP